MLCKLVEAKGIFFDKLFVLKPLGNDHVQHPETEGGVRSRAYLDMDSLIRQRDALGIDHNHLFHGAFIEGFINLRTHGRLGVVHVCAEHKDTLGIPRFFNVE